MSRHGAQPSTIGSNNFGVREFAPARVGKHGFIAQRI